jgi:hypothetical protein
LKGLQFLLYVALDPVFIGFRDLLVAKQLFDLCSCEQSRRRAFFHGLQDASVSFKAFLASAAGENNTLWHCVAATAPKQIPNISTSPNYIMKKNPFLDLPCKLQVRFPSFSEIEFCR